MRFTHQLIVPILLVAAATANAQPMRVVGVIDGDTVVVISDSTHRGFRCRLAGIDAPEKSQAFGRASKQALSDLVYGKVVDIKQEGSDRYDRQICTIHFNGMDINLEQVRTGMAWVYRRYNHSPAYINAEKAAQSSAAGLWRDNEPTPPWEFRHR